MADISSDDLNALRESMLSLNQTMMKMGNNNGNNKTKPSKVEKERDDEIKKSAGLTKKLAEASKGATSNLGKLDKEVGKLASEFGKLKALFGAATVFGTLFDQLKKSTDTYRDLVSVGQTFGGSMLQMQIAAAEARVPLEDFAKMIKNSSMAVAAMGVQPFTALGKQLRDNLTQFGMLGMTTEQLNDFMADYVDIQRSYGILTRMSQTDAADSMNKLAIETAKVTQLTGVERSEIVKRTKLALEDESLRSKMFMMQGNASKAMVDNLNKATVYLAGLPGDAGDLMSKMLAQSVGTGSAMLTEGMQGFVNAGMFGVTDLVDGLRRKIESGTVSDQDMDEFRKRFVTMGKQNMASLKYLSDFGNDPDAKKAVNMITSMANLDEKKIKDLQAQQKVTNFMLNLGNALQNVSGFLREKFFKALDSAVGGLEKFAESPGFKRFKEWVGELANSFGKWVGGLFNESNMNSMLANLEQWGNGLKYVGGLLVSAGEWIGQYKIEIQAAFMMLEDGVKKVGGAFKSLSEMVGGPLNAALVSLLGIIVAKKAINKVGSRLEESFHIGGNGAGALSPRNFTNGALKVWVMNNGRGSSSMDMGDGGRGGKKGRLARMGERIGRTAGRVGGGLGRGISKVARLGGVKGLAGGLGGLALGAGLSAMNSAGPFKGSGALNVLGGAASGAMTGAMFGPIGAAVGGVIGGAISMVEHWDEVSADVSGALGFMSDGITKSMSWLGDSVSEAWNGILSFDYAGVLNSIGDSISGVKDMIAGIFEKIGGWVGNMFSSLGDMFAGDSVLAKIVGATPIGQAVMAATKIASSVSSPNTSSSAPSVNTEALQSQVQTMQAQQQQILRENAELKQKLASLTELMTESVAVQRSGLGSLIDETKRGNRDLGSIARGNI